MKLTENEKQTLIRYHLGGIDAIRTETFKASCQTVKALMRKGFVDKQGLTETGKQTGRQLAILEITTLGRD